jgi:hypothetical protein
VERHAGLDLNRMSPDLVFQDPHVLDFLRRHRQTYDDNVKAAIRLISSVAAPLSTRPAATPIVNS